ncbi:MAG TPA: alpha/beta fold hydrolase [Actinomycetota bacterium]|nr:alpha/beta fold hydrolase [Actinomycetota bacterium]
MRRLLLLLVSVLPATSTAVARPSTCVQINVPVSLTAGAPADQTIWTALCRPAGAQTVHVLQSGATYGAAHWDFPYRPAQYSYVRALNGSGIATLNVDRLGIGRSSHPPSALVTVDANAFVLHQLIAGLRNGGLGTNRFRPFAKVVTVGNSLGSVIAVTEAARYGDVDGVVVTGANKNGNARELGLFAAQATPALADPRFAGRIDDPGYLTLPDETRCRTFWSDRDQDCDGPVATTDNALKETITAAEGIRAGTWVMTGEQGPGVPQDPDTSSIRVPVLLVAGSEDLVECGEGTDCSDAESLRSSEGRYYPNAPSVEAFG